MCGLSGCSAQRGARKSVPKWAEGYIWDSLGRQGAVLTYGSIWTDDNFVPGGVGRYRVDINFGEAWVSGILMVRDEEDMRRGTMMNEFGIRAFDFEVTPRSAKLDNVMPMMDKWYIRREIAADLQLLFWVGYDDYERRHKCDQVLSGSNDDGSYGCTAYFGRKSVGRSVSGGDVSVTLRNERRNITYTLRMIK